ncbi:MAG: hypothetical protein SF066_04155 [Thermoanaerobaculia bacterium]|nr:hypothetical protein [Thermoanaerobaculia bacterium]
MKAARVGFLDLCPVALVLLTTFVGPPARAELCSADAVPAATLLLPYFEVDVANSNGKTTVFSVNNVVPQATLAHVTLWTDFAWPTLNFDVYLTGYDVQTFNLRDLLHGVLPQTAIASQDPGDGISPRGSLSEDTDFPGCPIVNVAPPVLGDALIRAHQGLESPAYGGCVALPREDGLARGYVTVDVVSRCSILPPSDEAYYSGVLARDNRLWGSYFYVDPAGNSAQQENLVHIEACEPTAIGTPPPDSCGSGFGPGDYTFYGRYTAAAADQREPLPSTFALSYLEGGAFDGGTRLAVWRDTKVRQRVTGACPARWLALGERRVDSFDEEENADSHCQSGSADPAVPCFGLATQLYEVGNTPNGGFLFPQSPFGWLFLNLSHDLATNDPFPGRAQAWVTTVLSASGRYSVATDAVALDDLCSPDAGQGSVSSP